MLALAGKGLGKILDALRIGADALSDAEHVLGSNLYVAAFGVRFSIPLRCVENVDTEEMAEDGIVEQ